MRFTTRFAVTATMSLCLFSLAGAGQALPPRSVTDIVMLLRTTPIVTEEIVAATKLLGEPEPSGISGRELAEAWQKRARAAERLGLTDRYLGAYRAAWEASGKTLDQSFAELRVEYTAAEVHAGNLGAALTLNEELAIRAQLPGPRLAGNAFVAEIKARQGDFEGAKHHVKAAEEAYSQSRSSRGWAMWGDYWEASVERARGSVALAYGKFGEAENHFRRSAVHRERDMEQNQLRINARIDTLSQPIIVGFYLVALKGVADSLMMQGRLVEAEMTYRDILSRGVREFGTSSPLLQLHLEGLANVLLEQGRAADARELASATLEILQKQGTPEESRMLIATRLRLAAAHVAANNWQQAMPLYDAVKRVLDADSELSRRMGSGRGNKDWALSLLRTGRTAEALAMMERLLENDLKRFSEDDAPLAETRGFLAMAMAATNQTNTALEQFRRAVPILLSSQRDAADEGLTAASRRLVIILEAYLELLDKANRDRQLPPGFDVLNESFRVADVARASSVQRALNASAARAAIPEPALARIARDEQDLSNRISVLTETVSRLASSPAEMRLERIIAEMRKDIPLLKDERRQLRKKIADEFPAYDNLVNPTPPGTGEIQRILASDEAMLAIYVGERRTYVWAIPNSGTALFFSTELSASDVRKRVGKLRQQLDPGSVSATELDFDLASVREIYTRIVEPARTRLGSATHLLVVPHDALAQIPFALLPTGAASLGKSVVPLDAYAKIPWLIRDFAITQLPAASTLAALRRESRSKAAAGRTPFIGFGAPLFSEHAPADTGSTIMRNAPVTLAVRAGIHTRSASSASLADLTPLPDTAQEIREMAAALGATGPDSVNLGPSASETKVKQARLADYRVIAFATHGLTPGDLNGLAQPALAMSNPLATQEPNADGLLTMEEILALKLNADWVVLSACNTATSDGQSGEALSGLGRAFFFTGTRAVLATNWPVETVSARLLTTALFDRQTSQAGEPRAQSLRAAMLSLIQKSAQDERTGKPLYSYAHPLFWAPFSLVGDGGL
ncbi:MAG: hypothetical protein QG584_482 [Pseudomonadota bacterium]|nr:hypothetical protein [Pseudomonadota bacterium]